MAHPSIIEQVNN